MTFAAFTKALDNLVHQWNGPVMVTDKALSGKLKAIYDELREQTVHELAEAIRQREEALIKLHKHYLNEPK